MLGLGQVWASHERSVMNDKLYKVTVELPDSTVTSMQLYADSKWHAEMQAYTKKMSIQSDRTKYKAKLINKSIKR